MRKTGFVLLLFAALCFAAAPFSFPAGAEAAKTADHRHEFGEWTETAPATYREKGQKKRVCPRCGEEETRTTPRLSHLAAADCPAGDADMDGTVTVADARLILRLSVGFDDGLDSAQTKKADFDKKNGVTAADARYVLRVSVGLDPYLPTLKPGYTFKGYTLKNYVLAQKEGVTYVVSPYGYTLIANKSYALPASYAPGDLTKDCRTAFQELTRFASADGISIFLVSGYRSYETQDSLYRRYCAADGKATADTYSARPGHSEHQTGLAIDVNSLSRSFANTKEGRWLASNAHKYGFIIRYPKGKEGKTGYSYEPWHIRYVGKGLAKALFDSGESLEEFFGIPSVYQ